MDARAESGRIHQETAAKSGLSERRRTRGADSNRGGGESKRKAQLTWCRAPGGSFYGGTDAKKKSDLPSSAERKY